jgi:orotate phosphoribosyltransferase
VITDGGAKLELVAPFLAEGLQVRDMVVLVDREQGGRAALAAHGYELHSVFTLREVVRALQAGGAVPEEQAAAVLAYLDQS